MSRAVARRFAIVGAGPSGLYAAEQLTKSDPACVIDVFDRLPVPFGLVRYGVAPDHQATKSVARVLERVLARPNVAFHGNVEIGGTISLEQLQAAYDAVLLATGVSADRSLHIQGEQLTNVVGSWDFVSWINARPGHLDAPVDFRGVQDVVVVGLGNVAIDVARLLLKEPGDFDGSDLPLEVERELAKARIRSVTILGRGEVSGARFGRAELTELLSLRDVATEVDRVAIDTSRETPIVELLRGARSDGSRRLAFRFGARPVAVEGVGRVSGLRAQYATGQDFLVPADLLVTCIGFRCAPFSGLPLMEERFQHDGNRIAPGLYVAGWAATGPRGTIADTRAASHAIAERMLAETEPCRAQGLKPHSAVDFDGWKRIDAAERVHADTRRCRAKLRTTDAMLKSGSAVLVESGAARD